MPSHSRANSCKCASHRVENLVETAVSTDAQMRQLRDLMQDSDLHRVPVNNIIYDTATRSNSGGESVPETAEDPESGHRVCVVLYNTHDMRVTDHAALHAAAAPDSGFDYPSVLSGRMLSTKLNFSPSPIGRQLLKSGFVSL